MSDLIIEFERVAVPPDFQAALRNEFELGGMKGGRFAIGDITAEPTMIYLLWHDTGEVPVSMLAHRESFRNEAGTRAAARAFLDKWRLRMSAGK